MHASGKTAKTGEMTELVGKIQLIDKKFLPSTTCCVAYFDSGPRQAIRSMIGEQKAKVRSQIGKVQAGGFKLWLMVWKVLSVYIVRKIQLALFSLNSQRSSCFQLLFRAHASATVAAGK